MEAHQFPFAHSGQQGQVDERPVPRVHRSDHELPCPLLGQDLEFSLLHFGSLNRIYGITTQDAFSNGLLEDAVQHRVDQLNGARTSAFFSFYQVELFDLGWLYIL